MRSGFRIGKLFGIEVQIDWSWVLIFLLISWNWASALSNLHSEWEGTLRWIVAVAAAVLFFFSVLAHELAHSLMAMSRGIPVHSIRLHLFGGVSNLQREPSSPGGEFAMAILGPVTSLAIGGVLLLAIGLTTNARGIELGSVRQTLARLDPNITILAWLGSVNVGLGLFNLIPGFPLDGGRVLRSILWAITHNLRLATQWASWAGRGISWLMIFGGVAITFGARIPVLGQGFANGIWLAIIGWFLHNAAVQSYQQMIIREALEDVPVSRLMQRDPPTVSSERTVANFVHDYVMQSNDHGFPVIEDGRLVGLATLEDVRSVPRPLWDITYVRQIMTPLEQLAALTPEDNASRALEVLVSRDVRQLPVIRGDHLEGVLRRRDIVGWLQLQTRTSSSQNVVSL